MRQIKDIIDDNDMLAGDITDDVAGFSYIGLRTTFIDDRDLAAQYLSHPAGSFDTAVIRRYDNKIIRIKVLATEILAHHRHRRQIIDRTAEEALDLGGM